MGRIDRANGQDAVMERRHIQAMLNNIERYELVKNRKHPEYMTATEFYEGTGVCKQNFLKYYRRFIMRRNEQEELINKHYRHWDKHYRHWDNPNSNNFLRPKRKH